MSKTRIGRKTKKQLGGISEDQATAKILLRGPFPELNKMKKEDVKAECQMWRNVWQWVPDEVKYYVARTGQTIGLTMRNYKRYLGVLLETHWTLDEIEVGVLDKMYDVVDGKHYFERKIVKTRIGGLIDVQWIAERTPEELETEPTEQELLEATGKDQTKQQPDRDTIIP